MNQYVSKSKKFLPYILISVLVALPIFGNLNTLPVRVWDETRNALNAYEMYKNGNWIVTYFEGKPDIWNTKPPLLIWLQVFFIRLIGLGELAIRMPSAIAAFLTCIVLLTFSVKYLKNYIVGFATVMVLVCCYGYIDVHVTRTGDYDSLLILFTTLSSLLFFVYLEKKQNKYLYFFFLAISLGVLTKSVSALLFTPAFLLYALWQKQLLNILKNKHFYGAFSIFLVLVLGYYLLREHYNHGYIAAVQKNELGGRYLETIELHKQGFWYYYNDLLDFQIPNWYLLIPCGFIVGVSSKDEKLRKLTIFSTLLLVVFFLVISMAQTKLQWYNAPMYPFIALIIAPLIEAVFNALKDISYFKNKFTYNVFPYIFLFIILIGPYQKIINKTYESKEYPWDVEYYQPSHFLQRATRNPHSMDNYSFLYKDSRPHQLIFYEKMLQEKSVNFVLKDYNKVAAGDCVIISDQYIKDVITNLYDVKIIDTYYTITRYELIGKKSS